MVQQRRGMDSVYFLGFGVNAMQWPCGLISPSTILHVPIAVAVFPGMNWMQSSQSVPSFFARSSYCTADFASLSAANALVPVSETIAMPVSAQIPRLTSERREIPSC